jgi:CRISPR-associated protein Cmr6
VRSAFEHAFTWLGFGAKTALGYGLMRTDGGAGSRVAPAAGTTPQAQRTARAPGPAPADPEAVEFDAMMVRLRALPPSPAGQIGEYVTWCLGLKSEDRRGAAARAIVGKFERKWLKQRAAANENWKTICDLAER